MSDFTIFLEGVVIGICAGAILMIVFLFFKMTWENYRIKKKIKKGEIYDLNKYDKEVKNAIQEKDGGEARRGRLGSETRAEQDRRRIKESNNKSSNENTSREQYRIQIPSSSFTLRD